MAYLQSLSGEESGRRLELQGARSVLGRHPDCEIVLDAAAVSRQHAQILLDGGRHFVEDLHSRNGTFVNGQLIQGRRALVDGDRLKICDLMFAFHVQPTDKRSPEDESNLMLVDDLASLGSSTVMTKLDLHRGGTAARLTVNPEVKLRAMVEIMQNLSKAMALDEVLPKLLDSLFKIFVQADRGFVIMRSGIGGPLVPKAIKLRREDSEDRLRISRAIVNQALDSKEALLSIDASSDARFDSSQSVVDLRIRSVMCAPLIDGDGNALGVIQLDSLDQRQRFAKEDLDVLASVAAQAAVAIDNAQMHEYSLKQQAVARDLELAHKVQRGLLPSSPPEAAGYYFFDYYEAANQVGGDYYDYVEMPGGRIGVVLGDVSGKGVSAALLMARLSSDVRYCLASEATPAEAMCRINHSFCRSGWDDRFVTFVIAVLDPHKHEVTIVNAGHLPPLLRHASGKVEELGDAQAGVPLGIDGDYPYEQTLQKLAPGDCLVLCTDGISEAMNAESQLYGLKRMTAGLTAKSLDVTTAGRALLDDVRSFAGDTPQSDDMCLASFGRLPK